MTATFRLSPTPLSGVAEGLGRLLELVAALWPAPGQGQIRWLELLGLADVRCPLGFAVALTATCAPCRLDLRSGLDSASGERKALGAGPWVGRESQSLALVPLTQ